MPMELSVISTRFMGMGLTLFLIGCILILFFCKKITAIRGALKYARIFETKKLFENFRSLDHQYPSTRLKKGNQIYRLPVNHRELPSTYVYEGKTKQIRNWIEHTDTTGMVVIKKSEILFENYYHGNDRFTRAMVFSVSKSFVSFLIGVALETGEIESIHDPVGKYAPILKKSGYANVSIKNVLQMSSGIKFSETYADRRSDIVRLVAAFATGSLDEFMATLNNERSAGSYHKYISADTQALGMVLKGATNISLSEYMQKKLWSRLGAENDAKWLTDKTGTEMAFGGLNASIRDLAKFGLLFLNQGRNFRGEQLVSPDWIQASVTPDAPHLMPGRDNPASESVLGYGFQWWIPENPEGDYAAIGVFGQFIYVAPKYDVVIVKTSAYADYYNTWLEMELESLYVFRSIAKSL
jgi:CubicO group peptidase (beta-lactamase class C family)